MVKVNAAFVALAISMSATTMAAPTRTVFAREPEPFSLDDIKDAGKAGLTFIKEAVSRKTTSVAAPVPIVIPEVPVADPVAADASLDPALLQPREPFSFEDAVNKAKQLKTEATAIFNSVVHKPAAVAPAPVDSTLVDPAADPALLQAREPEPLSLDEVIAKAKEIGSEVKSVVGGFLNKGQPAAAPAEIPEAPVEDPASDPALLQAREPEPLSLNSAIADAKLVVQGAKKAKTIVKGLVSKTKAKAQAVAPAAIAAAPVAVGVAAAAAPAAVAAAPATAVAPPAAAAPATAVAPPAAVAAAPVADPALADPTLADRTLTGAAVDPAADPALLQAREAEPFSFDEAIAKAKEIGSEVKTLVGGFLNKANTPAPEQVAVADPTAEVVDPAAAVARRSGGMLRVRRAVVEEDEE